jgi:hypothetical protein
MSVSGDNASDIIVSGDIIMLVILKLVGTMLVIS